MDKASETSDMDQLKDIVISYAASRGLTVKTLEVESEHKVTAKAKLDVQSAGGEVLIEALDLGRKASKRQIQSIAKIVADEGLSRGVLISVPGFSDSAERQAKKEDIDILSFAQLEASMQSPQEKLHPHNILDKVFVKRMDMEIARALFMSKRKKIAFGLLGYSERLESIQERYSPLARYDLERNPIGSSDRIVERELGSTNTFWVNLNSCQLYHLNFGMMGDRHELRSTNVLRRMMDLQEGSVRIMSQVFEAGEIRFESLDPKQRLMMQGALNDLAQLEKAMFVSINEKGTGYISNLSIPPFDDIRYDIGANAEFETDHETTCAIDSVKFPINGLLMLLCDFFNCTGTFAGVTYLPYLQGRFIGKDGLIRNEQVGNLKMKDA